MPIEKIYLDPNAQAYTDDEIVGKVNTATANISRVAAVDEVALPAESSSFQKVTEAETTKIADSFATGEAARDAIVALADDARELIVSRPIIGQKKIYAVQTHSDGKPEIEQSDTPEV